MTHTRDPILCNRSLVATVFMVWKFQSAMLMTLPVVRSFIPAANPTRLTARKPQLFVMEDLDLVEIGNRVCGIRETFEEAGFLLPERKPVARWFL